MFQITWLGGRAAKITFDDEDDIECNIQEIRELLDGHTQNTEAKLIAETTIL